MNTFLLMTQLVIVSGFSQHIQLVKNTHVAKETSEDAIENAHLVYCNKEACEQIKSFKIAATNNFGCKNKYLAIEFTIEQIFNETETIVIPVLAYLKRELVKDEDFNFLSKTQNFTDSCEMIRVSVNHLIIKNKLFVFTQM
jgi:hypothetical protein